MGVRDAKQSGSAPSRSWGAITAALLGWVVVVVVGAGRGADSSVLLGVENLDALWLIVMVVLALIGFGFLLLFSPFQRNWREPPKRKKGIWILPFLVLALLLWRPEILDNLSLDEVFGEELQPDLATPEEAAQVDSAEPVAQALDIILLIGALAVAVGVWLWIRRGQEISEPHSSVMAPTGEIDPNLRRAISASAHELATATDPRRAVLNAYAHLESAFEQRDEPRHISETPSEHLGRVMAPLQVDAAPFVALGALYELARFSDQVITMADQEAAASALQQAQRELVTES